MNAALFQIPVIKKNRKNYAKTLLLNTNKVKNFRQDASDTNYTLFYYVYNDRPTRQRVEFKGAKTVAQFDALLREPANESCIPLYVTTKGSEFNQKVIVNRVEFVNIDSWVMAWDNSDGITATVIVDEGSSSLIYLQVNHTINQIDERASLSYSYSETGI